ncbi:MAG: C45 family peptidase, partial [Gemmatales bacterium]|nr:C45 family peptidase [Gemmatales bacterium]MDW8175481.1 C45 family peptidase [Gemmatales bacterium]
MRRWVYVTAAGTITVGLVFWLVCANLAESAFHYPEGKCECGRLSYISKIPVLEVWGEPEQIGQAMARLGVVPAERLRHYPRELFFAVLPPLTPAEWRTRAWQELLAAGQRLIANMPERYRREYESLRKHVPEAWHEGLLAGNTLFDIKRVVHCSAVIVQVRPVQGDANSQASLLLGRNLDFPTLGYLHKYSLVSVYRPRDRYAFVAVGFPGMIGVLSGMNEHGLCVAMLEVYESGDGSPPFDGKGIPYAVCLRQLLEECRTVEEADRRLREMPHTCYYNLAICDTRTGGVFEVSPGRICFRGLEQGLCACTNTFLSEPLQVKDG